MAKRQINDLRAKVTKTKRKRGRRTDPTAALVFELGKTEGRSVRDIAEVTGLPPSTVHGILKGAHGWDKIADGPVVRQHRTQQNSALEQAYRTLAAQSAIHAAEQLPDASYYQAVLGSSICIDKARLLAGESTQNVEIHTKVELQNLENFCELLRQSLISNDDPSDNQTK